MPSREGVDEDYGTNRFWYRPFKSGSAGASIGVASHPIKHPADAMVSW